MILIVGAGPVGLTSAMALKRLGVDVRIIDKVAARSDRSKALAIWPRTLEFLDIQGCVEPFIRAGLKGTGVRLWSDGKELVHVSLDRTPSVYRYVLLIPQSETERILEEELTKLGVRVERETDLESLTPDPSGVTVALRAPDRSSVETRVDYLLGCDGAHSTVRHGIGAQFAGTTMPSDWILGDLRIDGPLAQDELVIYWTALGVLAVFPIIGGRFRVIADMGAAPLETAPDPTLEDVQRVIDARGPRGLSARDPIWLTHFRINERKVKEYRYGRVFLLGDAAHVHSPAGGQGMNTGMQDGFNLAWKLALVSQGRARPTLLDSYSPERSAIGDQVLRNAGRLTEIATTRNPILREIRDLAARAVSHLEFAQQRIADQLTEVDLHYADGPLTTALPGASGHPAPGQRAPDVALVTSRTGHARLHALLATGRFAVLGVGMDPFVLPEALRSLALSARADDTGTYRAGHVYLIRPDAYVALSTDASGANGVIAWLERLTPSASRLV